MSLLLIGFAAMFGPLVGASMPWAERVHALVFGAREIVTVPHLVPVAPHLTFAFVGVALGILIAWIGMVWACVDIMRHGWPADASPRSGERE